MKRTVMINSVSLNCWGTRVVGWSRAFTLLKHSKLTKYNLTKEDA